MLDNTFLIAKEVIEKIEKHGFQAYFVGGCVRDLLLNKEIKDIDIATSAFPETVISLFEKVIPLGVKHGTVIVRHKHTSFEVTTFRLDGKYSDYRHPDQVEFVDHIDLDLERRDFTINALAMNKEGKIVDLFNGQADLANKLIRTVGKGELRFREDPLRIIRALRFSSQLGFSIEEETLKAMNKIKPKINTLAMERVTAEITKLISGDYIKKGISYLLQTEVYLYLPIMVNYPYIIKKLPEDLRPMQTFGELLALLHKIEPTITIHEWSKQWKCSNKTKNLAINLVSSLNYYEENGLNEWLVYSLQPDYYDYFLNLAEMLYKNQPINKNEFQKVSNNLPIQSKRDLAINGSTLIQMFPHLEKGPWIKNMLNRIEQNVVLNKLDNKREKIKEWIQCNPPETN